MIQLQLIHNQQVVKVDEAWANFFAFAQQHPYVTMTVQFRDGKPYLAETIVESFKFH